MPKSASEDLPNTEVTPDPALEKRSRRHFSQEYKLKILAQADACKHGELGPLLRREHLYSAQLKQWRDELVGGGAAGLSKSAPGPAPKLTAEQKEIARLAREVARLTRELEITTGCLDLQKKALAMLDLTNRGNEQ